MTPSEPPESSSWLWAVVFWLFWLVWESDPISSADEADELKSRFGPAVLAFSFLAFSCRFAKLRTFAMTCRKNDMNLGHCSFFLTQHWSAEE